MSHFLQDLITASAVTYFVIVGFVWLDAWFPVVPGESLIITGAVLAAQGSLSIWLVLLAGLAGAIAGDNFTYLLGRKLGTRAAGRLFRSEKNRGRLAWAEEQLDRRRWVILVSRFIPGGRTAVMFASGTLRDGVEVALSSLRACGRPLVDGRHGGARLLLRLDVRNSVWLPLLVSLALAAAITAIAELIVRRTRGDRDDGDATEPRSAS